MPKRFKCNKSFNRIVRWNDGSNRLKKPKETNIWVLLNLNSLQNEEHKLNRVNPTQTPQMSDKEAKVIAA